MQHTITLDVLSAVSEKGFSLDELVIETKALFEKEGMAGVVGLILRLVDEKVCMDIVAGKRNAEKPCCGRPRYGHQGLLDRQFRTSVGTVRIRWRRLECQCCGSTIIPLREFLGLEPYQSKTAELEKVVAEVVSEQSYRRSSSHLDIIGQIPVPKSTAHRWIATSDCDKIDTHEDTLDILFADGTGYKRRPDKTNNVNNRGELRVALGVDKRGQIWPLGAFSGASWEQIASAIKGTRPDKGPVADMLVSDGERGLCDALGKLCGSVQRCHWHTAHDLNYTLWQDDASKGERDLMQKELTAIIGIEIPQEDIEQVKDTDKAAIITAKNQADYEIRRLIQTLLHKGYHMAADYLIRASKNLFSYVDRWLATGIVSPRVSSLIERMMRELARRLKRMAFGWSEEGAAKMARIIIKRFTSANQWETYWKKRLNVQGNVILALRSIIATSPQPLGR
jgi:hypothetical protein